MIDYITGVRKPFENRRIEISKVSISVDQNLAALICFLGKGPGFLQFPIVDTCSWYEKKGY